MNDDLHAGECAIWSDEQGRHVSVVSEIRAGVVAVVSENYVHQMETRNDGDEEVANERIDDPDANQE